MNYVNSLLRYINYEFGHIASAMDPNAWAVVAIAAVLLGFFFLRGNVIRST